MDITVVNVYHRNRRTVALLRQCTQKQFTDRNRGSTLFGRQTDRLFIIMIILSSVYSNSISIDVRGRRRRI